MRNDYHIHFEKGSYDEEWVEGFFEAAAKRRLDEIGISEHSHTFPEFYDLYRETLILDSSPVGEFQTEWLKVNKFKYTIDEYFDFMAKIKKRHPATKIGIEVCNFADQTATGKILDKYPFDYRIGSVHYIKGWGFDFAEIKDEWFRRDLRDIYEGYVSEIEKLAATGHYDVLGHPFNLRLFKILPDFDVSDYLERAATALKNAAMAIDVNTGTMYRYPIAEISPYADFMRVAKKHGLPVIITSDAHAPADCGRFHDEARDYAKDFGYADTLQFTRRTRKIVPLS